MTPLTREDLLNALTAAKLLWMKEFHPSNRGGGKEVSAIFDAGLSTLVCLHDALLQGQAVSHEGILEEAPQEEDDFGALMAADPAIQP